MMKNGRPWYYFGCYLESGHYLFGRNMRSVCGHPLGLYDGQLAPQDDRELIEGRAIMRTILIACACIMLGGCWYTPGDGSWNERLDNDMAREIIRQDRYGCCWDYSRPVYRHEHWR